MRTEDMALVQGWADTRATLRAWLRHPGPVFAGWARGSLLVAVLLAATVAAGLWLWHSRIVYFFH